MNIFLVLSSVIGRTPNPNVRFSTATVNNQLRTATVRATFSVAIDRNSFNSADLQATRENTAGVDVTVSPVGAGSKVTQFDLNFTLPNISGRGSYSVRATATVSIDGTQTHIGPSSGITFDFDGLVFATFGTPSVDRNARNATVRVTFSRAIAAHSLRAEEVHVSGLGQWRIDTVTQVGSGSTATQFDIKVTGHGSRYTSGIVRININNTEVEIGRNTYIISASDAVFVVPFPTNAIATASVNVRHNTRTANVSIAFGIQLDVASVTESDFTVTGATIDSFTVDGAEIRLVLGFHERNAGRGTLDMTGRVSEMGTSYTVSMDPVSFTYSAIGKITARQIRTRVNSINRTAAIDIQFSAQVNPDTLTADDFEVNGATLTGIRRFLPFDQTRYILDFTFPSTGSGTVTYTITGIVNDNSDPRTVEITNGSFSYVEILTATFGTPTVNNLARTATVRVTFPRAIDVSSFGPTDIDVTSRPSDPVGLSISPVGGGRTARQFDLNFALRNQGETVRYQLDGASVTAGTTNFVVRSEEGSFSYGYERFVRSIDGVPTSVEYGATFIAVYIFSEEVEGLGTDDFLTDSPNATAIKTENADGRVWIVTFTAPTDRSISSTQFTLKANAVTAELAGTGPYQNNRVFNIRLVAPEEEMAVDASFDLPNGIQTGSFKIRATFTENVSGIDGDDFRIEGIAGARHTVAKISDSVYDITIAPPQNSRGTLNLILNRRSAIPATTSSSSRGPIVDRNSGSVDFDTRPAAAAPVHVVEWILPDSIQRGATVMASVIFSRALVLPEVLLASDIGLDGIAGARVTNVAVDDDNDKQYNITVSIPLNSEGVLDFSILG